MAMQTTTQRQHGCGADDADCVAAPVSHAHKHHHHGATHAHGGGARAMLIALLITLGVMALEIVGSIITGSLALLADAGHMLTDVAALSLSLGAAWLQRRPATTQRTFGFHRAEILAALINGLSLLALSGFVIWEAFERFAAPPAVDSGPMLLIASIGLAANLAAGAVLLRSRGESLNVRSAYLHVLGDALGSVGAIIAALLIALWGWYLADPLLSMLISALILWSAWRLLRDTVDVLLESAPRGIDVAAVRRSLQATPGVADVHDLHIWSVASNFVALSGHVRLTDAPSCAEHQRLLIDLRRVLRERWGISHATLQLEEPGFDEHDSRHAARDSRSGCGCE